MTNGDSLARGLESQISKFKWAAGVAFGLGGLFLIFGVYKTYPCFELSNLGALGSYLQGTTAAFWALAGLCLIYVAFLGQRLQIYLQNKQFDLQQKQYFAEQESQQKQLKEQREQFRIQQESINRQNFENSLFQLINLHNQIVAGMRENYYSEEGSHDLLERKGRSCFEQWYKEYKNRYAALSIIPYAIAELQGGTSCPDTPEKYLERIQEKYIIYYQSKQSELGHYFRNLYHIFKFVRESNIKDQKRYAGLVRAQLSQYELAFLFYNGLTPIPPEKSENKFKSLIEEFQLLKHLDISMLTQPSDKGFYKLSAFE
jgi:hypothetical protein